MMWTLGISAYYHDAATVLAPYGTPRYADLIREKLVKLLHDGSFFLDQRYFDYCAGVWMTSKAFDRLFGGPPRRPDAPHGRTHRSGGARQPFDLMY